MKNFTSILGWLLLVAVLSVPSFLFYNWWSKGKQQNSAELAHEPVVGSVFPSEKGGQPAAERQQPQVQVPVKAEPLSQAAPVNIVAAPAPQAGQGPSASSNPPAETAAPAQKPALSTGPLQGLAGSSTAQIQVEKSTSQKPVSYYNPKSTRDPTFSPEDYRKIKEEQLRREEVERMQQQATVAQRPPKEPGPETRISLQGIVGNAAIINGDMYNVGQTVRGVKILKIGPDYIIAEYKGKKFRKVLR